MIVHERDPKTGRPVHDGREVPPAALTDPELDEELLVAAGAAGRLRFERFVALAAEFERRHPATAA